MSAAAVPFGPALTDMLYSIDVSISQTTQTSVTDAVKTTVYPGVYCMDPLRLRDQPISMYPGRVNLSSDGSVHRFPTLPTEYGGPVPPLPWYVTVISSPDHTAYNAVIP